MNKIAQAIVEKNRRLLDRLLEASSSVYDLVNGINLDDRLPINYCIDHLRTASDCSIAYDIIMAGFDLKACIVKQKYLVLHKAAKAGNYLILRFLLSHYYKPDMPELLNQKDDHGNTVLDYLVKSKAIHRAHRSAYPDLIHEVLLAGGSISK